ncbi:MAG: M48 family metallopeptidase [Lachnospiraceae bacterium]|nr:M48 family metallopeptidase [Lachnospiraceae bacterium]
MRCTVSRRILTESGSGSLSGNEQNRDNEIKYYIKRSRRKTISVEIEPDLSVLIRAPLHMPDRDIRKFLESSQGWIIKHRAEAARRMQNAGEVQPLSMEEIRQLANEAVKDIPERVRHYATIMGVTYGRITIRNQKSRWGSCSSKGNLNFNCLLMLAPPEHRDYVIVHELCHRKEMNHSKRFWAEVEKVLPDYKKSIEWFKENGESLMARMGSL